MFWAYMLRCADGTYYTGHTDELERRVAEHQSGELPGYTQSRLPVELVWCADFPTRIEALEAERRIKGWSRIKKEALIRGDWSAIERLARRHTPFETGSQPPASIPPQGERYLHPSVHPEEPKTKSEASRRTSSTSAQDERSLADSPSSVRVERSSSEAEKTCRDRGEGPIIVLVRPQLGENIGKAARAMLNFGLTEMRLVAPRDGWPNPSAGPAAAGADEVLDRATVHDNLADAVADCANVYATTVRKRGMNKPVVTPAEAAQEIHDETGRSAIVFGPERSGLESQDVALARKILTVPVNPEFGSLNLAQAVILCAYEWSKFNGALVQPTEEEILPPAPQDELEGLIRHFEAMLEPKNYFWPESRASATRKTLRNVLTRPGWNSLEVRTLRGVLSTLEKAPRKRD